MVANIKSRLAFEAGLLMKIGIFALAGSSRLISTIYLSPFLYNSKEFITPWNSFKRIQEAVYLQSVGLDVYEGDLFHLLPVHIYLFQAMAGNFWLCFLVYTLIDLLAGYMLKRFAVQYLISSSKIPLNDAECLSNAVLVAYLFNPMTIGACSVFSLSTIVNFLVSLFANLVIKQQVILSTALLLIISSIYPYYIVLISVLFLAFTTSIKRLKIVATTIFTGLALFCANTSLNPKSHFLQNTMGFFLTVHDLTPNVGAFWYFFVQIFDHYREFFLWVFQLNIIIYLVPLSLTLRKDPYVTMLLLLMQISVFTSYPSYAEAVIFLALIPAFAHLHEHIRHKLIIFGCFCATLVLTPIMVFLMSDFMHAYLRDQIAEKCRAKGLMDINEKTKKFILEFRPF